MYNQTSVLVEDGFPYLPVADMLAASDVPLTVVVDPSLMILTRCERRARPKTTSNSNTCTFVWQAVKGQTHFLNLDIFLQNLNFGDLKF